MTLQLNLFSIDCFPIIDVKNNVSIYKFEYKRFDIDKTLTRTGLNLSETNLNFKIPKAYQMYFITAFFTFRNFN